jgi:hypothetical protein
MFPWEASGKLTGSLRGWRFAHPKNLPAFPPSCCFPLDPQDGDEWSGTNPETPDGDVYGQDFLFGLAHGAVAPR